MKNFTITGTQRAICQLLDELDRLFTMEISGWEITHGLALQVGCEEKEPGDPRDLTVRITPAGWPKNSSIVARICNMAGDWWQVFEGSINAYHLKTPAGQFCGVTFKAECGGFGKRGVLRLSSVNPTGQGLLFQKLIDKANCE